LSVSLPLSSRVNTSTVPPQILCTQWPFRQITFPSRHMLPELERLITAFHSPLPFPRSSRAGLVPHMAQAMSTTQTIRLPRAVSTGSTSFPILPLTTPTRTSLVSFEPLLTLLTCCCLSHFVLLFFDPHRCPALALGQFQGALAKWYSVCGPLDLLS
jgi:hypothetical protein